MKMTTKFQSCAQWLLCFAGAIILAIPLVYSFWAERNVDSAVILSEMEKIHDGFIPYRTLHLNYPPLYFYICIALKWLFHIPYGCYSFYLAIHYCFMLVSAWVIYRLCRCWSTSKPLSLFCAWLFMMVSYWTQGNIVIFEEPSITFGLLASYFCVSRKDSLPVHYLWIGALAACSFLVKQFGAGFIVLCLLLIVTQADNKKCRKSILFIAGYCVPIVLCLLVWGKDFIDSVILNGYGTETALLAGYDTTLAAKIHQIMSNLLKFSWRICPVVIGVIAVIPSIIKKGQWRELLFCLCGILGFSLSFWFVAGGLHYTLYMIPFAILLIPLMIGASDSRIMQVIIWSAIICMTVFALYSTYRNRIYKGLKSNQLRYQMNISQLLESKIEKGKTVWIPHGGIEYLYYFNHLTPPNLASVGFACGPLEITREKQWKQIMSTDYVISFTQDYPFDYSFDDEVRAYLSQFPSDTLDRSGSVVIHKLR